jgi:hypothetical protein
MTDMKQYFVRQFVDLWDSITHLRIIDVDTVSSETGSISAQRQKEAEVCLNTVIRHADFLGLPMTARGAGKFLQELSEIIAEKKLEDRINELVRRFEDETDPLFFLYIPSDKLPYFKGEKIAASVLMEFPRAAGELHEACECYALSANTACVFHLMRALEMALKVIAKSLSIPDPTKDYERNWGKILGAIKDELEARKSATSVDWSAKRNFYEGLCAQLEAVRNPWRNGTMHVEINYDEEMALDIFNATDALFRNMSTRLSESILAAP